MAYSHFSKETHQLNKINFVFFLSFLFLIPSVFAQAPLQGQVVEVIDGRTCILEDPGKEKYIVQLQFIEIPEDEEFAQIVKSHLEKMILNKPATFHFKKAQNNINIGKIVVNQIDITLQLLRDGAGFYLLFEDPRISEVEHNEYQENEALARKTKIGLWGNANLAPNEETLLEISSMNKFFGSNRVILGQPSEDTQTNTSISGSNRTGSSGNKTVQVKGHTRKNGTYVAPHTRSAPRRKN